MSLGVAPTLPVIGRVGSYTSRRRREHAGRVGRVRPVGPSGRSGASATRWRVDAGSEEASMQIYEHLLWPAARHKDLIAEARQIHEAASAVREARKVEREGPESQGPVVTSVAKRGAPPHQLRALGSLPSRRTAW